MDWEQRVTVSRIFQERAEIAGADAGIMVVYGDDFMIDRKLDDIAGDVLDDKNIVGKSICDVIESQPANPGETFEAKVVRLVMLREPAGISW